jgi:outer membrane protein assembly factor BamB
LSCGGGVDGYARSGAGGRAGCGVRLPGAPTAARPAGAAVSLAWSFGEPPAEARYDDAWRYPDQSPPEPAAFAVSAGRVAIVTRDGCLALLDSGTGRPLGPRSCETVDTPAIRAYYGDASDVAFFGDTVVSRVGDTVRGFSTSDLELRWSRSDFGTIVGGQMAEPRAVGGAFCLRAALDKVVCLAPKTGETMGAFAVPSFGSVMLADEVVGLIGPGTARREGDPGPGQPVRFFRPDGGLVSESALPRPTFEASRPLIVVRGYTGGPRGAWVTRFVAPKGEPVLEVATREVLSGGALIDDVVMTSLRG